MDTRQHAVTLLDDDWMTIYQIIGGVYGQGLVGPRQYRRIMDALAGVLNEDNAPEPSAPGTASHEHGTGL